MYLKKSQGFEINLGGKTITFNKYLKSNFTLAIMICAILQCDLKYPGDEKNHFLFSSDFESVFA